jgi:polysaccharide chain length determinant protein (PEP-CTERM system associated)
MQQLIVQILQIVRGAWRFRWQGIAVAWLVAIAGWIYVQTIPDKYESNTFVYVDTQSVLRPLLQGIAIQPGTRGQISMMQAVMLSRPNLEKVAEKNDLLLGATTPAQEEAIIDSLQERLVVSSGSTRGGTGTNRFRIAFDDEDPKVARNVVQTLLDTFMEDTLGIKRSDVGVAQRFLLKKISDYEQKLAETEARLAEFKRQNLDSMQGGAEDYFARIQQEQAKLEALQQQSRRMTERRNELSRQLAGEEPSYGVMGPTSNSPIDGQISAYRARIEQLLLQYTEKHPEVKALQETIARLEEEKRQGATVGSAAAIPPGTSASEQLAMRSLEMNPVYQNLRLAVSQTEADLAEIRAQIGEQEAIVAELRSRVDSMPERESELKRLTRDYDVYRAQYNALLQRLQSANIFEEAEQSTENVKFRVIEPPTLPAKPSAPDRLLMNSIVLLASLAIGALFAVFLSQVRPTFSTLETLRQVTGVPVIGSISSAIVASLTPWYRRQGAMVGGALGLLLVVYSLNILLADQVRHVVRQLTG